MKNFVVTLDRQPEKFESFVKRNAGCGIAFERFSASDGSQMGDQDVMATRLVAPGTQFTKGAVGCAASHGRIWKWAAEENAFALVFEDDAAIRYDISTQLAALLPTLGSWDFLTLGYNTDSILDLELAPGTKSIMCFNPQYPNDQDYAAFQSSTAQVAAFRVNGYFGGGGYVISPEGARRLLELCFPMDNRAVYISGLGREVQTTGLDGMMNSIYPYVNVYACFAPLVLPGNNKAISTTYTGDARTWS
jgi:GR25 family glycosyltransferase involved in LPS biosynthesis